MPRRLEWTEIDLQNALDNIYTKKMGINKAAREFGVPSRTLRRQISSNINVKKSLGGPTILGIDLEKQLASHLQNLKTHGYSLVRKMVRRIAYIYAKYSGVDHRFSQKNGLAGREWFLSFSERFPNIEVSKGFKTGITNEVIDNMFTDYLNRKGEFANISTERIEADTTQCNIPVHDEPHDFYKDDIDDVEDKEEANILHQDPNTSFPNNDPSTNGVSKNKHVSPKDEGKKNKQTCIYYNTKLNPEYQKNVEEVSPKSNNYSTSSKKEPKNSFESTKTLTTKSQAIGKKNNAKYCKKYRDKKKKEKIENPKVLKKNSTQRSKEYRERQKEKQIELQQKNTDQSTSTKSRVEYMKEYMQEYRRKKKLKNQDIQLNTSLAKDHSDSKRGKKGKEQKEKSKIRTMKVENEKCKYGELVANLPPISDDAVVTIQLEPDDDQIQPIWKEEVAIEDPDTTDLEGRIAIYIEDPVWAQLDWESNNSVSGRDKISEITDADVEAQINSVVGINFLETVIQLSETSDQQSSWNISDDPNYVLDDFNDFAQFIATRLRTMKTPEDQMKVINDIVGLIS